MRKDQLNSGIVTFPISKAGNIALSNLADILCSFSDSTYVITGNEGDVSSKENKAIHVYKIRHRRGTNVLTRILNYVLTQLRISYKLAKLTGKVNQWVFFIGGEGLLLPILTAKLMRKPIIIASAGSGLKVAQVKKDPLSKAIGLLTGINYTLSTRIILYSERLIEELGLEKYRNKVLIACEYFLDLDRFKVQKQLDKRDNLVGYIGALVEAKGLLNFLEAIPEVLEGSDDIEFLIGGEGRLQGKVEEYLREKGLNRKVKFVGWIPHDELPKYLNELKLFVLPSYTEGIPGIMLEAMACGTPVLVTPVGAIPDAIEDEKTGFILEDKSPAYFASSIIQALEHPRLYEITKNARKFIEQEYCYETIVQKYKVALEELMKGRK